MIYVRYNTGNLKRTVDGIARRLRSNSMMEAAGYSLHNALAQFYEGKGSTFWARFSPNAQEGFRIHVTPNRATASIGGYTGAILAHKIHGGTVRPKYAGALTLPLSPEARRAGSPRDGRTPELFIFKAKSGHAFLAQPGPRGGKSRSRLKLWYILLKAVTHRADPDSKPTNEYIKQAVSPEVVAEFRRIIAGK